MGSSSRWGPGVRSVPLASGEGVGTALGTEPSPPLAPLQAARISDEGGGEDGGRRALHGSGSGYGIRIAASARQVASASPWGNDQVTGSRSSMRRPPDARFAAVR